MARVAVLLLLVLPAGRLAVPFRQTATGFRLISWLSALESSLTCERGRPGPPTCLALPPLLPACPGHGPALPVLAGAALFGLAQGPVVVAPESGGGRWRGRAHLGRLAGPLVAGGGGAVLEVAGCQGGRWQRDRRALDTLRYSGPGGQHIAMVSRQARQQY
jgi:hypothetical protein